MTTSPQLKIVVLGSPAVGKTSLLTAFATGTALKSPGAEYVRTVTGSFGGQAAGHNLSLWDCSGDSEYDALRPLSYAHADAFVVCFSLAARASLADCAAKWIPEARRHASAPVVLAGLKSDLGDSLGLGAEAEKLAGDVGAAAFVRCSSVTLEGVQDVFAAAVAAAAARTKPASPAPAPSPSPPPPSASAAAAAARAPPKGPKNEYVLKVMLIGETATGKTALVKRYVHNIFIPFFKPTIGVDFALQMIPFDEEADIRLQFWDVSGQERFGSMTNLYYSECSGALLVFDQSRPSTFAALQQWASDLSSKCGPGLPKVLMANKADLEGKVSLADVRIFVEQHELVGWCSCSAKTGSGTMEGLMMLIQKMVLVAKEKGIKATPKPTPAAPKPKPQPQVPDNEGPKLFTGFRS